MGGKQRPARARARITAQGAAFCRCSARDGAWQTAWAPCSGGPSAAALQRPGAAPAGAVGGAGCGMIRFVVIFLVSGQPVFRREAVERFDTPAACCAFAEAQKPGLMLMAQLASRDLGRPVTLTASCLDRRPAA